MKANRWIFAILLALTVLIAACGDENTADSATDTSTATISRVPTDDADNTATTLTTDTAADAKLARERRQQEHDRDLAEVKESIAAIEKPVSTTMTFADHAKGVDSTIRTALEWQEKYAAAEALKNRMTSSSESYAAVVTEAGVTREKADEYVKTTNLESAKALLALVKTGKPIPEDLAYIVTVGRRHPAFVPTGLVEEAILRADIAGVDPTSKELGMTGEEANGFFKTTFKKAVPALVESVQKYDPSAPEPAASASQEVSDAYNKVREDGANAARALMGTMIDYGFTQKELGITDEVMRKVHRLWETQG